MQTITNSPIDLRDRSLEFSKDVIRFAKTLELNQLSQPIIRQLLRSSTSIGANFVEAKDSASKKDFRNKVLISKKEASETMYWLKLCEELRDDVRLRNLQQECREIILILQQIITTLGH
jgi:four helix bundle protein